MVRQSRFPEKLEEVFVLVFRLHQEEDRRGDLPLELPDTLDCQGGPNTLTVPANTC